MRLISAISYKWAEAIANKFCQDHNWRRYCFYWIRLIFGTLIKMGIILIIASLLDVFWSTFYCAVTYGVVKVLSGGMHHRSLGRSILLSVMLFITMGVVADTFMYLYKPFDDILTKGPYIYVWVMFYFSLLSIIFYVPVKVRHKIPFWNVRKNICRILTILFSIFVLYYTLQILDVKSLGLVIAIWTAIAFNTLINVPFIYFGAMKLNQILNYK